MTVSTLAAIRFDERGLVPVVVQDGSDGRVLMLAYADLEAIDATVATGQVHFHSRSRDRLWRKGETSGNVLRLVELALDCDGDAVLATVEPSGPACHTGRRSCFDAEGAAPSPPGFGWLDRLWTTIADRANERPAGSYTASLLAGGVDATARKVVEEATEVLLAAKDDATAEAAGQARAVTSTAFVSEAADLVYHLLVLLAERGAHPASLIAALRARGERSVDVHAGQPTMP